MRANRWAALVFSSALAACSTVQTTNPGAIGVERKQMMLVSESDVEKGAEQAYAQELDKAKKAGALNKESKQVQRVRAIAQRLIPQTTVFRPDAAKWNWEVNVQSSDDVNAYCMPGGKIMVYTGLIEKLQASDAELSAVIGHEMAHALREHTRERVSRAYAEQLALAGVAAVTGAGEGMMQLASQVTAVTFQLPHSREQESEADRIGLELMARAGYDPNAAVTLWQKMAKVGGGGGPEFLSTHPSSGSREKQLEADIPRVLPLYQAAKKGG
ncbi:MAG TPA: M48 family metallopeptidase [Steroidobacteraceae bacterium]|nr:M48 family metallopeptidase [Steroidobacteraceae bacterium]